MQALAINLMDVPANAPVAVALAESLKASGISLLSLHRGTVGNVAVIYRVIWNTGQTDLIEPAGVEKQGTEELALLIAQGVKASVK